MLIKLQKICVALWVVFLFSKLTAMLSSCLLILLLFPDPGLAQKRRILRLMIPWAEKADAEGQKAFQSIVDNEMQHIDTIYTKLADWATQQGSDFMKAFQENLKIAEKEAYRKREELGDEVDQLPPLVMDAFQVVDMFRQDPTKTNLEEKKMISDLKKTVEPKFHARYEILLERAQKLQDEYGINLFRSPFAPRRKRYLEDGEL